MHILSEHFGKEHDNITFFSIILLSGIPVSADMCAEVQRVEIFLPAHQDFHIDLGLNISVTDNVIEFDSNLFYEPKYFLFFTRNI